MITAGFLRQKFEKIYEYTVEECEEIHVSEYPAFLYEQASYSNPLHLRPPPAYPKLKLIEGRAGIFIRTFFECPGCGRPRMSLFLAPDNPDIFNYKCRICIGLVYSSQRHGQRHPLRKKLTHRKKVSLRKETMHQANNKRPRKSRRKPWENPKILVEAEKIRPRLNGLARESFEVILNLARNCQDKKVQDKAKRLLKRYVTRLKQIEKAEAPQKIVLIR